MTTDDRHWLAARLQAFRQRMDELLHRSPTANLAVSAVVGVVVSRLVEANWSVIVILAIVIFGTAFFFFYVVRRSGDPGRPKFKVASANSLVVLTRTAVLVLAVVGLYTMVGAVFAGDDGRQPPSPTPTDQPPPPTTDPPDTSEPAEPETSEPDPTETLPSNARPTSVQLEEVKMRRPDIRGTVEDPYVVTSLDYTITEPWDFANVRLCASARIQPAATPAWKDSILFQGEDYEAAANASATFYSAEDAHTWLADVVGNIDRCNIELGPRRPRIAGEDETLRLRSHISTYYGRLNVDRVIARVDNVIVQVVVARYEGDNQTVLERVAAACIGRMVDLVRES